MLRTIVVGIDGRPGGRDALALGVRLAHLDRARIVAVRVLPLADHPTRAASPAFASVAERDARREIAEELARADVAATVRVLDDLSPARALHRVAAEEDADVIVVGATHRAAAGLMFDDAPARPCGATATGHREPCSVAAASSNIRPAAARCVAPTTITSAPSSAATR